VKYALQILLVLILTGCQSKENNDYKSKITGKWIFDDKYYISRYDKDGNLLTPPLSLLRENLGFNFLSKDSCEANEDYVDLKSLDVDYYRVKYGRKTIYKIENDSLKVFNRTSNRWKSYYIMILDENNLVLNDHNEIIQKFARVIKD
jgi:hypothetical protein